MYGVPIDLPTGRFLGLKLDEIGIDLYVVHFLFSNGANISAEGDWELRDRTGSLVDRTCDHALRTDYRVNAILGVPVSLASIDPSRTFTLFFETGHALSLFDDSEQYESFSLWIDDRLYVI